MGAVCGKQSNTSVRPPELPASAPESERKVHRALLEGLPAGWHAWHGLRIRTDRGGQFREADFVLAVPRRGLVVLEVKGGRIEKRRGRWTQNGRPLEPPPLDQAHGFRKKLLQRFSEEKIHPPPPVGVAVCFPDTDFTRGPRQDDLRGIVVGRRELPHLAKILPELVRKSVPDSARPFLPGRAIRFLDRLWEANWIPKLDLGARSRETASERVRLDAWQFELLEGLAANPRVLVTGRAGTGKTVLATEFARREAARGRKTALFCFTDALGFALASELERDGVFAAPIRRFAKDLLEEKRGVPVDETGGPEFWEEISLEAALANLERTGERWDTVVVDEAQDLGASEWSLVETCLAPDARLWIFQDDRQVFWPERKIPESLRQGLVRYELPRAYRNPPGILALVRAYAGEGVDEGTLRRAFEEREVGLVPCHAETLRSGVDKEVRKLLADGFRPEEIAVVSLRGMKLPENIMHEKSLGGCPTARATDPDCQEKLVCDTFLRFKGLERPAVIVTDLDTSVSRYATRAYIACSRALSVLRIVGVRDEMAKDSVLRRFLPP